MSDDELLAVRIADLPLSIEKSALAAPVAQVQAELLAKGLRFSPVFYLGESWFVLKEETAVSIPFYLASPRLRRLERRKILEVEGGTRRECLQLLRHEVGHAVDHAYRLFRRRDRQRLFGLRTAPYPESYTPKPYSRAYVRHIRNWYAQSHPDEDFAETFAVWLTPGSDWRRRYQGWRKAREKLELVDRLMGEIAGRRPAVVTRRPRLGIATMKETLGELYERRLQLLAERSLVAVLDKDLRRVFEAGGAGGESAARFIGRHRRQLRDIVARWSGTKRYHVELMLREMARRCRELGLRSRKPETELLVDLAACGVAMVKNELFSGEFSMT